MPFLRNRDGVAKDITSNMCTSGYTVDARGPRSALILISSYPKKYLNRYFDFIKIPPWLLQQRRGSSVVDENPMKVKRINSG